MPNVLTSSQYTPPGVVIGELIRPSAGNLNADARVCSYVGQGSRLAKVVDAGIRRSFVYDYLLSVSTTPPYAASLPYQADGVQDAPIRLFNSVTGVELRSDQWSFTNNNTKIMISPEAYDPMAEYHMDYQSTSRDVVDPLPISGLRSIKSVGNSPGRAQFKDFTDFYTPFSFAGPTASSTNSLLTSSLTSMITDGSNVGGGVVSIDPAASYNHNYNRFYELTVIATSGLAGSFQASFGWTAKRYSGGVDSAPPVPLHSSESPIIMPAADQTIPATLTLELEFGVKVAIAFGGTNFAVGDKFYFNGVGPSLVEFDGKHLNTNQYLTFSAIGKTAQPGSTGVLAFSAVNTYTGTYNTRVRLKVLSVGGVMGSRVVNFSWATYGETIGTSGLAAGSETAPSISLTQGISLAVDFGLSQFVAGDVFDFDVYAPRAYYQAKDNRVYKLSVTAATNPGADQGYVEGTYSTGTPEGGFGSWTADANIISGTGEKSGSFALPDGLTLFVRNAIRGNINGTSLALNDKFTASITSLGFVDWSLTSKVEEIRETTAITIDRTGAITGVPGTPYTIVSNIYTSGTVSVQYDGSGAAVSFYEMAGTRFIAFVSIPTDAIRISYEYRGEEPAPGQLYYFTAYYVRPQGFYNNPTLVLSRQDGRTFLAPAEINNHLYIMNEIGFDNGMPAGYYIQPFDGDGDSILTREDFRAALEAHEGVSRATDLCVLSHFESLSDSLEINERANNPFEKREQMLWTGAPIGTPIGDANTLNTLVFLARKTLQTTPQSPAIGTRVLVAPTVATKDITLESGVTTTVTLDGSFVAGAASALVNSFNDPATTVLRKNLSGFKTLQVYTVPENQILGNASTVWFTDRGSSVYRFEEDVTVHTASEEVQLISVTTQKQFVTKIVRREMDDSVIGVVPQSAQAAVGLIKAKLASILIGLHGRGLVADWQDDAGNVRDFDPDSDILVVKDPESLTKYDLLYSYFVKAPIKRIFGLYAINTNNLNF